MLIKKRLIILIDGNLTPYRTVHIRKILQIVENFFVKIIVIYNARSNLSINSKKIKTVNLKKLELNSRPIILKLLDFLRSEFTRVKILLKYSSNSDYVLFLGIYQPISLFVVKLRGGYPIHFCGGFDIVYFHNKFASKIYFIVKWATQIAMLTLTKKLIFETPSVIQMFNLNKFRRKSIIEGHLFVDLTKFYSTTSIQQRNYDVGYVGAFSIEKGIIQFVRSIPYMMNQRQVAVQIVGDGYLNYVIKKHISTFGLNELVHFKGPEKYFDMPKILNNIKLLVVPSYSEGLPNIIIEAMACGNVILATPVGGIPDVIKDGETGFLLNSISPKYMANRIIELLNKPEFLEDVSKNAEKYVKENFGYEKTLKSWQKIIKQLAEARQ